VAGDPFAAYLRSLTDPGSIVQAAILKSASPAGPVRTAAAIAGVAASAPGTAVQTRAGAVAAFSAAVRVGASPADLLAFAQASGAAAAAAGTGAGGQAGTSGPAGPAGTAAADAVQADSRAAAQNNTKTASLASDRIAAGKAAIEAGAAATSAFYATSAAGAVAQGASGLAIDAAAKFMGGGTMARQAGLEADGARAVAAYQATLEAIPAVGRLPASPSLAANAQSGQDRTLPRSANVRVPAPGSARPSGE
jgi:hypothetical protein